MNYILFWFLVSMVVWGLFELVMFLLNESDYRLMRFQFCLLGFGFIPVFMISLKHRFQAATRNLHQIIKFPSEDYRGWIEFETKRIFNLTTIASWLRIGLTTLALIILSMVGRRYIYPSTPAVILLYVIASVVFVIGIHGQYAIEKLLGFLTRIETFPIHLRFSQIDHPLLVGLFRFLLPGRASVSVCDPPHGIALMDNSFQIHS